MQCLRRFLQTENLFEKAELMPPLTPNADSGTLRYFHIREQIIPLLLTGSIQRFKC